MALLQCRGFLEKRGLREEEAFDTAGAARDLAATPRARRAAIASEAAGRLYGLISLAADIQDDPSNWTTFLLLSRKGVT